MQKNFIHSKSFIKFRAFLDALRDEDYHNPIYKDEIRHLIREELILLLRESPDLFPSLHQNLSTQKIFLPFTRWKRNETEKSNLLYKLTILGYIEKDEKNPAQPRFIQSGSYSHKLIWLKKITHLIYFLFCLERIHNAIFLHKTISETISENFLVIDHKSKKFIAPSLESVRTQCSRIIPRIEKSECEYPGIEDILRDVFNKHID